MPRCDTYILGAGSVAKDVISIYDALKKIQEIKEL